MSVKRVPLAQIKAAWGDDSLNLGQAARQIGVHPRTLRDWAAMLNLPPRPKHMRGRKLAEVDPDRFTNLWQRGDRVVDIAAYFKRSPPTISKIARRLGLDGRNRRGGGW